MGSRFKNRGEAVGLKFQQYSTIIKPSDFKVGDPVLWGIRPGVAMTDRDEATSTSATVWFYGTYEDVSVIRSSAVTTGQILYFDIRFNVSIKLTDTFVNSSTTVRWGYAAEDKAAGTGPMKVWVGY